ncbi:hypothetical protein BKA65DRAFT_553896 [Rhexocercosporidium sp. MPI-PUGE-AT-0058]|nr:hypothetical protein BKA65DRAFT_553896 [Rhexocercosporidium sp. MPI-PUGE-AT-0058]
MSQAVNSSVAIYDPEVGSKHTTDEAQLSAFTNTRRDLIWDRRPSKEEPLSIVTTFEEADRSEVIQSPDGGKHGLPPRLRYCSRGELSVDGSTNHKLNTSAAIVSARGIVELARVKIDGSSLHNLLPRSIASRLGLPLHFGSSTRGNLIELPPIAEAEAEMKFAMGAAVIREETLMVEGAQTAFRGGDELASIDASATGDETIIDGEGFADAVSHQSSDDDLYYIGRQAEKEGN